MNRCRLPWSITTFKNDDNAKTLNIDYRFQSVIREIVVWLWTVSILPTHWIGNK